MRKDSTLTSTEITSGSIHFTGTCTLHSIVIKTDGTNNATLTVYDGIDNSGTALTPADFVVVGTKRLVVIPMYERHCETGIYIDISGTGASVQAIYGY